MSASHSEPMGARGWEPDFSIVNDIRVLQSEISSTRNQIGNAWRQGKIVPDATKSELEALENKLEAMKRGAK